MGISGLTSALLLRRAGHYVTLVSADPVEATTSHLAAAVWFPTAFGGVVVVSTRLPSLPARDVPVS